MDYKHCCVVDTQGYYKTLVLVHLEPDEDGGPREMIQHYTLEEGERLIDTQQPTKRPYAGADGFVRPRWDDETGAWVEGATNEEIVAWEATHPAPVPAVTPPTTEELADENKLLRAQVTALTDQNDFQEELIVELAGIVYA